MEKLVLVHLSDIHFSRKSGASAHDLDADLRNEVLRDVRKLTSTLGAVSAIVVTGDIAFSGKEQEFKYATAWLKEVCEAVGCADENVCVVPGNHDVDRAMANDLVTKMLHERLRGKAEREIDDELAGIAGHAQSAGALLAPLAEYNRFAGYFKCSMSAAKPFWERDLALSCGTVFRLRGMCSVLVSNAGDARGNVVLGTAQATMPRVDGVEYLTLCHHPPDWLRDQDAVVNPLESRARIQLFGHKHAQRVQTINDTLRITAGAMHPERDGSDWEPTYNVLEINRVNDAQLRARLHQRRWHKVGTEFVAEADGKTGLPYRDYLWQVPRRQTAPAPLPEPPTSNAVVKDIDAMPPPNPERRLTYRFLTLPFRKQMAVAQRLNILTDEDREMSDEVLFRTLFTRAAAAGLLDALWEETEKCHPDAATNNPFKKDK